MMLSMCKTLIDVLKFSIHFWGTSSISVPHLWRDSLLFKGFQYYFHSIYPTYRSNGKPAEVNMMLSLCKTLIDVLKFSIHFWGTSSISVPQLWRDSLLFKGFSTTFIQYIQHSEVTANQLKWNRCFHCTRLKSMYWNSVSTSGALLQFQFNCC